MFTRILCIFIVCIFIICIVICVQKNEEQKSDKIDDLISELDKLINDNIPCTNCKYETDINSYIYSCENENILITTDKENNIVNTSKVKIADMEELD